MKPLTTSRTLIREIQPTDAAFIHELMNSREWIKNIGDRNIKSIEHAENYIRQNLMKSYEEFGFGLWVVELNESKIPIGTCGLLQRDYLPIPDIGFAFLPDYIGKGFGQESAKAVIQFAAVSLDIAAIAGFTNPDNQASIKLLEKLGFIEVKQMTLPNGSEVTYFERSL